MIADTKNVCSMKVLRAMLVALVALAGPAVVTAQTPGWSIDVDKASKQADSENKDLIMNFTGSDWCGWCIRLRREIFGDEEFQSMAKKSFVLVQLDFPNDKSKMSLKTRKQNAYWHDTLDVQGFPSVYLTDAKGLPYAQTGYQPGGPERYLEHLADLRTIRRRRDELFAKADRVSGRERAELIDAALQVVGPQLAFGAYTDRIEEILRLDANDAAGLRTKYEQKLAEFAINQLLFRIHGIIQQEGPEEALRRIDEADERYRPQGEIAIQLALFKAHVLGEADRLDDAVRVFDDLIRSQQESIEKIRLYTFKAKLLEYHEEYKAAIVAIDAALKVAEDDSVKKPLEDIKESLIKQATERREP